MPNQPERLPPESSSSAPDREAPAPGGRRPITYPFVFRLTHWLLTGSVIVLILTGISLHAGARPGWSLLEGKVPSWFWTGRVQYWHLWASLVFAPATLVACWTYLVRRVQIRLTHIVLLVGSLLLLVSGFFLMNPPGAAWVYTASVWIHAVVGLVVLPIWFLWHAYTGFTRYLGGLIPTFHLWAEPRALPVYGLLVVAAATSCVLMNGWPFALPWRDLEAKRIDQADVADSTGLAWDEARPLEVQLANGSSFDSGRTRVELRAMHNGEELFVRAAWADDDEEYFYWPWKRTEDGWRHLQTSEKDEYTYYEDKFSLVFPIQQNGDFERFGCAASCHLHEDWGWGYKGSDRWLDVWHWKAARTGSVGQVDDKYWSWVDLENKDVGRHGDPKESGGYTKNFAEGTDHPLFLPESLEAIAKGSFPKEAAVAYTAEKGETIEPGTIIPGVVTEAFVGDRGQVSCVSQYEDGRWVLYIRRPLETGSAYDVQFVPGYRYAFGCAAFDHAGKRHALALPTFHLVVEP